MKFFLSGCQRSGTTLMRFILDSHKKICVPPETRIIYPLSQIYDDKKTTYALKTIFLKSNDIKKLYETFLKNLYSNYNQKKKKNILIDKSAYHLYSLKFLSELYGKSKTKFIFLFRDGLDVANSLASYEETFAFVKGKNFREKFVSGLEHWVNYNEKLLRETKKYKILLVKYEKLQSDPNLEMKRVFKFLGISYYSEILNFSKFKHDQGYGDKKILKTNKIIKKIKDTSYNINLPKQLTRKYQNLMYRFNKFF